MSDESTLSEPKVGAIVREYAGDIVEALKSDPEALANALDPVWTKAALKMHGNNFSLVRRASDFTGPSDPIHGRYYVEEHPFPGGGLRVTNDWYADRVTRSWSFWWSSRSSSARPLRATWSSPVP